MNNDDKQAENSTAATGGAGASTPDAGKFDNSAHNTEVKDLFGSIAKGYDFLNHTLSMGFDIYWRKVLVKSVAAVPAGPVLDLAAGTFDVSIALGKAFPARHILAGDLCLPMLVQGLPKISRADKRNLAFSAVSPMAADAYNLPLPDNSVAAITVAFGLRNMVPRVPALREMHRVLVPGGRLSILEFGSARPKVLFGLYNFYLAKVLPRIGGLISGEKSAYEYLAQTIYDFPVADELDAEMREAGFDRVKYRRLTGGIVYVHCGDKIN